MKAIDLIKNNIFTLLNSGCSNNEIYEAIEEIETLQQELKKSQDNYNMIWNMYSELRRKNQSLKKSDTYTYKKKENK